MRRAFEVTSAIGFWFTLALILAAIAFTALNSPPLRHDIANPFASNVGLGLGMTIGAVRI